MILFISGELILFLLVIFIAGIAWLVENLWWIILTLVIINVVIPLIIYKCPELFFKAVAVLLIIGILALIITYFGERAEVNNEPVKIYRATDNCTFYDESHETIQIPQGAIVAIYYHPEEKSKEARYVGSSQRCQWYYDGKEYSATVSVLGTIYNWDVMNWNLEEIGATTYQKLLRENWWEYSD